MSVTVHPDPQEPAGGFAFLELVEGSLPDEPVSVAVFDTFGERWLAPTEEPGERIEVGNANWQSDRVEFGPYDVHHHDGADWVRIGPEIVNKLEEYAPLRLFVGGLAFDVSWPDTVRPRTGAAVLGGVLPVRRKQTGQGMERLVGKLHADPNDVPPPEPEEAPVVVESEEEDPIPTSGKGSLLLPILLLVVFAILAAIAWYYWPENEANDTDGQSVEACSLSSLEAVPGGFAETAKAIRECGSDVSADVALRLVEAGSEKEDADALLLFGTLYDGEELDPRVENLIGLTFDDDPAKAVEYYARAAKAGSTAAKDRLSATCERLADATATLAKGAYDDYCS